MAMNILVVDDSDVIRAMISRTLRLAGLEIGTLFEASNGREALDLLGDEWVDLVLADINMPVMSGSEMIDRMRARPDCADVPVVVVSTEGATQRIDELMAKGVSAWVRKPFTPEEIRDAITQVMAQWGPALAQNADIDEVMTSVLETFAFAFPDRAEGEELPAAAGELVCATITFTGAATGTMTLAAPRSLCSELAANILGVEMDHEDAMLRGADTLGEIANIAAGHIATRIDPHVATHLNPPIVERMDRREWDRALAADSTRSYVVESQPVLVSLGLRQAARAAS